MAGRGPASLLQGADTGDHRRGPGGAARRRCRLPPADGGGGRPGEAGPGRGDLIPAPRPGPGHPVPGLHPGGRLRPGGRGGGDRRAGTRPQARPGAAPPGSSPARQSDYRHPAAHGPGQGARL